MAMGQPGGRDGTSWSIQDIPYEMLMRERVHHPASIRELLQLLKVPREERPSFKRHVDALVEAGELIQIRGHRFGLAEHLKHTASSRFDRRGKVGGIDHFEDRREVPVLRRFGDGDVEFGGAHAPAFDLFPGERTFGGEGLERASNGVAVGSGIGERSN